MTNDIVTQLRESNGQGCTCGAWNYSECGCSEATWAEMYITDAADEIERLRRVAYSMAQTLEINGKWLDVNENGEYVPMKADAIFLDFYEDEKEWANEK